MNKILTITVVAGMSLGLLNACVEPGEITGISAATGGVVGAGLGAIVGNQTGDPGAGLVLGAAAGAGAGAAVGNVLESQDRAIKQQDIAIERQEQVIRAQRGEIEDLRTFGQDKAVRRSPTTPRLLSAHEASRNQPYGRFDPSVAKGNLALRNVPTRSELVKKSPKVSTSLERTVKSSAALEKVATNSIIEKKNPVVSQSEKIRKQIMEEEDTTGNLAVVDQTVVDRAVVDINEPSTSALNVASNNESKSKLSETTLTAPTSSGESIEGVAASKVGEAKVTGDCLSAEEEYTQANGKTEAPDKLFHIRRALRLCPDDARFHASLGDVYKELGRKDDAEFEYSEALKLAPANEEVKAKLAASKGVAIEPY
jgi:tetratricopeptide (TPR) repeat protein